MSGNSCACAWCKWWKQTSYRGEPINRGECRFNAPSVGPDQAAAWPITSGRHSCGSFDPKAIELPSTWEHISEPVSRVIEKSANAYLNGSEDVA